MAIRPLCAVIAAAAVCSSAFAGDWDKAAATRYLDGRQKAWFAWSGAKTATGEPCVSCHTGLSYLLARPALRSSGSAPTEYEQGLRDSLRRRIAAAQNAEPEVGVESVLTVLFVPEDEAGWERLWKLQIAGGPKHGTWPWYDLALDPYEMPESPYFGASLAAMAVAQKSADWRNAPSRKPHIDALRDYLRREFPNQPLHNKLAAVWASTELSDLLQESDARGAMDALRKAQRLDGGWSIAALGPWREQKAAPPQATGSHAYATAWAAMVMAKTGEKGRSLDQARAWLRSSQDRESGAWRAQSMNKRFPKGSMMERFMDDAATAWAVVALRE
jgi:squalene-hopene/tetraprenyl-beta-curcumene cyclase